MSSGQTQIYKLFIKFYSPVILYHPITLDALIAYGIAMRHNENKGVFCLSQQLPGSDSKINKELNKLILNKTQFSPVSIASYFQPIGETTEYLDSWKKRFESKYSYLADFGKTKRRVDTSSGKYRSYNMPLPAVCVNSGYFVFAGLGKKVLKIMKDYIVGIGKKRGEGFGWIDFMELTKAPELKIKDIIRLRPIPKKIAEKNDIKGDISFCAWKAPYWLRTNSCECVVPSE